MVIDLIIMGVIGCVIEALGIFAFNKMVYAYIIASAFSLLIMLLATTRWGAKGLVLAPVLALGTIIGGQFIDNPEFRVNYDWKLYIAILFSLLSFYVNVFWYKKKNYRETFKSASNILLLVLIDIVVSLITLSVVYLIFKQTFQLLGFIVWNSLSYMVLCVGAFALKGLGVMVNVKEELIYTRELMKDEETSFSFDEEEEGELKDE